MPKWGDLFLESTSAYFGLYAQSANSVKALMSASNFENHVSVIAMGLIPSIKPNKVKTAFMAIKNDPGENMKQLQAMHGASDSSVVSLTCAGAVSKQRQSIEQMKRDYVSAAVSSVAKVDDSANQVIDLFL
jgi:hypothetical protein